MKFEDVYFSKAERYSLGMEADSHRYYISIPVSNGIVDYEEYYAVSDEQYEVFLSNRSDAVSFADACRMHKHDDLLLHKPGTNRGTPV
jgi:hypothetical protein